MSRLDHDTLAMGQHIAAAHARERNRRRRAWVWAGLLLKPLSLLGPRVTTPLFLAPRGDASPLSPRSAPRPHARRR